MPGHIQQDSDTSIHSALVLMAGTADKRQRPWLLPCPGLPLADPEAVLRDKQAMHGTSGCSGSPLGRLLELVLWASISSALKWTPNLPRATEWEQGALGTQHFHVPYALEDDLDNFRDSLPWLWERD